MVTLSHVRVDALELALVAFREPSREMLKGLLSQSTGDDHDLNVYFDIQARARSQHLRSPVVQVPCQDHLDLPQSHAHAAHY